ncbi:MAG: serine/threonine protein kinase [Deltaproteobacteria bacterium]|nr:serine/threonine protein kinase [Deltaproteobacteria bacterium]
MEQDVLPEWAANRYEALEPVGQGTYTTVYKAKDRVRGDVFAIKLLLPEHRGVPRIRDRFVTEARAMTRLVHPNIVRIFDVGGALSDEPAIVMEYVGSGDLRTAVPRGGLPAGRAARLLLFTLAGLAEAHMAGVTHRGLCPEAVLLDAEGQPKVSDFGVARLTQHQKQTMTMSAESLGSIYYTSPEQRANPRNADARSDVYAAGALLFFLATGRDPPDLSQAAVAEALVEQVDPVLRPIVVKATAEDPADRYQDAREMGQAVRALFTGA